jgi:hypothetical protein
VVAVRVIGAAFGLAPLHAPKAAAVTAATATAVVTRANVLTYLRDRDTTRVNHVICHIDRTPLGSACLLPPYPTHTL